MAYTSDFTERVLSEKKKKKKNEVYTSDFVEGTLNGTYKVEMPEVNIKQEDIAPVKKQEEENKRSWFKSGLFEDGYQFGDITKTITGTATDLTEDITKGILGIGEGLIDTGAFLVGGTAGLFGNDNLKNKTQKFIEKNLVESSGIATQIANNSPTGIMNSILHGEDVTGLLSNPKGAIEDPVRFALDLKRKETNSTVFEESSVLGDKSDSLVQSGGQLLGTVGLQAVGVPWFATTGVTGFGKGTEQAFNEDATYGEAGAYGLVAAGAEILTEKLSGGISFGGKTLDDALLKPLTEKIANKTVQSLVNFGLDVVGEGTEEVVSELIQNVGKKLTYEDEKTWNEILASEEAMDAYLESFIGGAVLGGVGSVSQSITKNQAEGIQQEIAKKQEEYNNSQDAREKQIIQETINGLNEELNELTNAQKITDESELRKQNFTYEAQETDSDIRKAVYESASKVMNNTETTHKFVDVVAKIAKEKGTTYKFTNNEQLKQLGYAKEGMTVNGLVNENGEVLINIDSAKALNTVVGHETTHLLEGTKEYDALKQVAIEYSKTKGDYNARIEKLTKLYEGTNADIEAELTSDIVGEYLFTDENFVKELSVKQPTVFEKIRNFISDLVVRFKGTDQEKQLRQLQRTFEKAYKAQGTQTTDAKYSINDNQSRTLTKEQQEYFKDSKVRDKNGNLLTVYHGTKQDFTVFENKLMGKNAGNALGEGYYFTSHKTDAEMYKNLNNTDNKGKVLETYIDIKNPLNKSTYNADEMISKVDEIVSIVEPTRNQNDEFYRYHRDYVEGKLNTFIGFIDYVKGFATVQDTTSSEIFSKLGYDGIIDGNEYVVFNSNQVKNVDNTNPTTNPDIRYSLSEDTKGNELKPNVQKWAENSKARDEDGNLKVLYHGTATGEFTVFDKNKASAEGDWGAGFYFTDSEYDVDTNYEDGGPDFDNKIARLAEQIEQEEDISYEEAKEKAKEQLYKGGHKFEVYLNIENPAIVGETYLFNNEDYYDEYNMEDFDSEEEYYEAIDQLVTDDIDSAIWAIEREYDFWNGTDEIRNLLYEVTYEGGIEVQELKNKLNELYLETDEGLVANDVARIILESLGYDGIVDPTVSTKWNMSMDSDTTHYIVFKPNQIKSITNENPTSNPDINLSLSAQNEEIAPTGQWNVRGEDVKLQVEEAIAPLQETISNLTEQVKTMQESLAPTSQDIVEKQGQENFKHLPDDLIPPEIDETDFAPIEDTYKDVSSPVQERDIQEVGNRKVKAYQYEHPEVRPYFQVEADNMLGELSRRIEGERYAITDQEGYTTEWAGVTREIPEDIAYLKDNYGYSYEQIEKGLKAIIEDNGAENNAVSKRLEILIDERLTNGYVDFLEGYPIPPNQEYKNLLIENDAADYYSNLAKTLDDADIAPEQATMNTEPKLKVNEQVIPQQEKVAQKGNTELADTSIETQRQERAAKIMAEAPTPKNRDQRLWAKAVMNFVDKGATFEKLSLKTKNRELIGKWDSMLTAAAKAQNTMINGVKKIDALNKVEEQVSKSLDDIRTKVINSGKVQEFYEYMYHSLNTDRMSLESKAQAKMAQIKETALKEYDDETIEKLSRRRITDKTNEETAELIETAKEYIRLSETKNKPVFGDSVTAETSQKAVEEFEMANPEFTEWAKDVYQYNNALRDLMVENNIISQETADLFAEMYPHYVPIKRVDTTGNAINVPLDTNRTGINTPIKRAKGGNQDILPMFDTMAGRTLQTYKAISKNNFGIELKNTLKSTVDNQQTSLDEILDNVDQQESLLQEGKNGQAPTFTVFEKGNKVTYEITQDMYDALKPVSDSSILSTTFKPANIMSNLHRGVLTEYNPVFMLTNAIKDSQDILMNSQHAAKTYVKIPEAYAQILGKGMWYREYMANGGEQNSYFDSQDNTYGKESIADKILPLKAISKLNNIIELSPRLAEYIASRESGRSVEVSMLDAARVTTNFKAGGDITKWANRNGATFLNASVQGISQQVRNVREAHANGLKGYANLATKFALAGVPAMMLNSLLWEDDEEYEELSDYVKTNYWIVGKYGDGNFIRIPKGRMITVIQESFNQMKHLVTGDEQADLNNFLEVLGNNLAPNNPVSDNILSPIVQAVTNKTWYGGDLVPSRLQDVPAAEQYDESIDKLSIGIGQETGISPYKINYVLDQFSGGIGDVFLPMMTQQAEGGKDDLASNLLAPLVNKFTVDSTMKNQSVSDLYELSDKLTMKANSSKATDEDVLKNKFINSVKTGMNELYKQKREIQNSDLPDSEKYEQVREIQKQINYMAKAATRDYEDMDMRSNYADVGGIEYYKNNDGEWTKVREEEASELNELGMTYSTKNTYFKTKNEISAIVGDTEELKEQLGIEDEDSDEYKEAVSSLNSDKKEEIVEKVIGSGLNDKEKAYLYKKFYNSDTIDTMVETGISVDDYLVYTTKEFKADYNSKGNAISGSRKNKVIDYVNTLDMDIPQKAILIKSTNTFKFNDYNNAIVQYVGGLDINYEDKVKILKDLDMTVDDDGNVYWK